MIRSISTPQYFKPHCTNLFLMERTLLILSFAILFIVFLFSGTACNPLLSEAQQISPETKSTSFLCSGNTVFPDLDALSIPKLRKNIGNGHLAITTTLPEAQIWFNQGLNLLHGFWHFEAYRAFSQVIELDPQCAMGYWGIAMCQPGFGGESEIWLTAIEKAQKRQSGISEMEIDLIQATNVLLKRGIREALPYFKKIMESNPDAPDAAAFATLMMRHSVQTESQSQEVKALLENALKRFPNHVGLQHYYVHTMEVRPDFALAKPFALKMTQQAPGIPHLLHMPGHLYFLDGEYLKAAEVFERARTAERNYHRAESIPKIADQNYLHNLHYLTVAYAELNEYQKALKTAKEYAYITMKQVAPIGSNELLLLYEGRILPALVNIRFRKYDEAIDQLNFWLHTPDFPLKNHSVITYLNAMKHYCEGMNAILKGNEDSAIQTSKSMKKCLAAFESLADFKKGSLERKHLDKTYDIMMLSWYELVGWGVNMDPKNEFISEPWEKSFALEKAIGYEEPPRMMYPVAESKAILHKKRGEQSLSKKQIQMALKKRPASKIISSI